MAWRFSLMIFHVFSWFSWYLMHVMGSPYAYHKNTWNDDVLISNRQVSSVVKTLGSQAQGHGFKSMMGPHTIFFSLFFAILSWKQTLCISCNIARKPKLSRHLQRECACASTVRMPVFYAKRRSSGRHPKSANSHISHHHNSCNFDHGPKSLRCLWTGWLEVCCI